MERELASADLPGDRPMLTESIAEGFAAGTGRLLGVPGVELVAGSAEGGAVVVAASLDTFDSRTEELLGEVFGPLTLLVRYRSDARLLDSLDHLEGSLTATLHAEDTDDTAAILARLERTAGRVLFAGWPTGVAVTWAQHHGGPWPSTTSQFTSVGATAVRRFLRPIAYQDAPQRSLPPALREDNPLRVPRRVDGVLVA